MALAIIAVSGIIMVCIVGHVAYERLPKRADGANAALAVCAILAVAVTFIGVAVGFITRTTYPVWAIIMFVLAALFLALGFTVRRHIVRAAK